MARVQAVLPGLHPDVVIRGFIPPSPSPLRSFRVTPIAVFIGEGFESQAMASGFARRARERAYFVLQESADARLAERIEGLSLEGVCVFNIKQARGARRRFPHLPIVAIALDAVDRADEPFDVVALDEEKIGAVAAEHLLDCGLEDFSTWDIGNRVFARRRAAGFCAALAARGARRVQSPFHPSVANSTVWGPENCRGSIRYWLNQLSRPTGVLAPCDGLAATLLHECVRARVRVPEELAVVSVNDNAATCEMTTPALSSVSLPWESMGELAATLLHERMSGKVTPFRRVVMGPIGVTGRQSTNLLAVGDDDVAHALRIIRAEPRSIRRVDDVIRKVPANRKTLERKFHLLIGRSLMQEVKRAKVDLAKNLLATTDHPISQIAELCGLDHRRNLAPAFRKYAGMTAGAYRKQSRRGQP
jgi:LacI family transcriptional regulator